MSASTCIPGGYGLWPWWLLDRCTLPFSPGSLGGQQEVMPSSRQVGVPSSKYDLSGVQPMNLPLGILVDSGIISPERRLPGTRAVESSVVQAFGAHPSIVMDWDEKARQEDISGVVLQTPHRGSTCGRCRGNWHRYSHSQVPAQLDRRVAFFSGLVRALMGSPDLRHLPPVLHVREGYKLLAGQRHVYRGPEGCWGPAEPLGIPPQLFGLSTGSWGLVAGVSQRYVWGMPSGTDGSSSEISVNQGRMGSSVGGDWSYISVQGDLWWTIPGCPVTSPFTLHWFTTGWPG